MSKAWIVGPGWLLLCTSVSVACAARFDGLPRLFDAAAASSVADEVRLTAAFADGRARPCECPQVTAIVVAIQNASERMLTVRYESIVLRGAGGTVLRPLPAFDLEDTRGIGLPVFYTYPWSNFRLAAPLSRYYRGFWSGAAMARDTGYYQTHHAALVAMTAPVPLPNLVRAALPEGDLERDGHIAGLLYFMRPDIDERATLTATLTNPDAGGRGVVLDVAIDMPPDS